MIKQLLINNSDRTSKLVSPGSRESNVTDVFGRLAQTRNFKLNDNSIHNFDSMSPYKPSGLFANVNIRNQTIKVIDISEQTSFFGNIKKYGVTWDKKGWETSIQSTEAMGVLLKFIVEENTKTQTFEVDGSPSIGTQIIPVKTGVTEIADNTLISFTDNLIPRYQVQSKIPSSGSPTTSITLDRGIEIPLSDGDNIVESVPKTTTIADALRDAFNTVGLLSLLGTSFEKLKFEDLAYTVILNVTRDKELTFGSHLSKLLEMGNYVLLVDSAGKIDIRRGWQWNESNTTDYISESEVMAPVEFIEDDTNLVIGADTIYKKSDGTVGIIEQDVESFYINAHAGSKRFQPIKTESGSSLSRDYPYLYADSLSATFYGNDYMQENKTLRTIVMMDLKGSYSSQDTPVNVQNGVKSLGIEIGKDFALTMHFAPNYIKYDEPVAVKGFSFDENLNKYTKVKLILTNYKNLVRNSTPPELVIFGVFGVFNGIVVTMDTLAGSILLVEIFDQTKVNLIVKNSFSRATGTITDEAESDVKEYIQFIDTKMQNNVTYYYRLSTVTGNNFSKTKKTKFIPKTNSAAFGKIGVGIFTFP